jgi:DNA modification methylase
LDLIRFIPKKLTKHANIPKIAKDQKVSNLIETSIQQIPTNHKLYLQDAREMNFIPANNVHLVLTSPPYWTLKEYNNSKNQLGFISDYEMFLLELDRIWNHCFHVLIPGGRLICVVGDVCLSRKKNKGRHTVTPLHASIQEHCRHIGFDNLAPIIWHKISNANYETNTKSNFLGKPYEPNSIIKNDIEFILMERKPGGYRQPSKEARLLSVISETNHKKWFNQIWTDIPGTSTKYHPAPFPIKLAERLIRMFSFVGDTILDPFLGTGTTSIAAANWGRHSIGVEVDQTYFNMAYNQIQIQTSNLFKQTTIQTIIGDDQ